MDSLRDEIGKILKEELMGEKNEQLAQSQMPVNVKPKMVRFNKGLETEYNVVFSERGFLIGNTRLSFEELENAISKQYIITLNDGFVLDAVKMQQILRYKDLF